MLSIFRSQSENICENGVEIELKIQNTLPSDNIINNDSSKERIKDMYLTTKTHDTLYKLNKLAECASKDFIKEDIIKLFETLFTVDNQSYYDIMCITSAIICALDEKNHAVFSNIICNIIMDENTKELPDPATGSDAETINENMSLDLYNIPEPIGGKAESSEEKPEKVDTDKENVDVVSTNKKSKNKES